MNRHCTIGFQDFADQISLTRNINENFPDYDLVKDNVQRMLDKDMLYNTVSIEERDLKIQYETSIHMVHNLVTYAVQRSIRRNEQPLIFSQNTLVIDYENDPYAIDIGSNLKPDLMILDIDNKQLKIIDVKTFVDSRRIESTCRSAITKYTDEYQILIDDAKGHGYDVEVICLTFDRINNIISPGQFTYIIDTLHSVNEYFNLLATSTTDPRIMLQTDIDASITSLMDVENEIDDYYLKLCDDMFSSFTSITYTQYINLIDELEKNLNDKILRHNIMSNIVDSTLTYMEKTTEDDTIFDSETNIDWIESKLLTVLGLKNELSDMIYPILPHDRDINSNIILRNLGGEVINFESKYALRLTGFDYKYIDCVIYLHNCNHFQVVEENELITFDGNAFMLKTKAYEGNYDGVLAQLHTELKKIGMFHEKVYWAEDYNPKDRVVVSYGQLHEKYHESVKTVLTSDGNHFMTTHYDDIINVNMISQSNRIYTSESIKKMFTVIKNSKSQLILDQLALLYELSRLIMLSNNNNKTIQIIRFDNIGVIIYNDRKFLNSIKVSFYVITNENGRDAFIKNTHGMFFFKTIQWCKVSDNVFVCTTLPHTLSHLTLLNCLNIPALMYHVLDITTTISNGQIDHDWKTRNEMLWSIYNVIQSHTDSAEGIDILISMLKGASSPMLNVKKDINKKIINRVVSNLTIGYMHSRYLILKNFRSISNTQSKTSDRISNYIGEIDEDMLSEQQVMTVSPYQIISTGQIGLQVYIEFYRLLRQVPRVSRQKKVVTNSFYQDYVDRIYNQYNSMINSPNFIIDKASDLYKDLLVYKKAKEDGSKTPNLSFLKHINTAFKRSISDTVDGLHKHDMQISSNPLLNQFDRSTYIQLVSSLLNYRFYSNNIIKNSDRIINTSKILSSPLTMANSRASFNIQTKKTNRRVNEIISLATPSNLNDPKYTNIQFVSNHLIKSEYKLKDGKSIILHETYPFDKPERAKAQRPVEVMSQFVQVLQAYFNTTARYCDLDHNMLKFKEPGDLSMTTVLNRLIRNGKRQKSEIDKKNTSKSNNSCKKTKKQKNDDRGTNEEIDFFMMKLSSDISGYSPNMDGISQLNKVSSILLFYHRNGLRKTAAMFTISHLMSCCQKMYMTQPSYYNAKNTKFVDKFLQLAPIQKSGYYQIYHCDDIVKMSDWGKLIKDGYSKCIDRSIFNINLTDVQNEISDQCLDSDVASIEIEKRSYVNQCGIKRMIGRCNQRMSDKERKKFQQSLFSKTKYRMLDTNLSKGITKETVRRIMENHRIKFEYSDRPCLEGIYLDSTVNNVVSHLENSNIFYLPCSRPMGYDMPLNSMATTSSIRFEMAVITAIVIGMSEKQKDEYISSSKLPDKIDRDVISKILSDIVHRDYIIPHTSTSGCKINSLHIYPLSDSTLANVATSLFGYSDDLLLAFLSRDKKDILAISKLYPPLMPFFSGHIINLLKLIFGSHYSELLGSTTMKNGVLIDNMSEATSLCLTYHSLSNQPHKESALTPVIRSAHSKGVSWFTLIGMHSMVNGFINKVASLEDSDRYIELDLRQSILISFATKLPIVDGSKSDYKTVCTNIRMYFNSMFDNCEISPFDQIKADLGREYKRLNVLHSKFIHNKKRHLKQGELTLPLRSMKTKFLSYNKQNIMGAIDKIEHLYDIAFMDLITHVPYLTINSKLNMAINCVGEITPLLKRHLIVPLLTKSMCSLFINNSHIVGLLNAKREEKKFLVIFNYVMGAFTDISTSESCEDVSRQFINKSLSIKTSTIKREFNDLTKTNFLDLERQFVDKLSENKSVKIIAKCPKQLTSLLQLKTFTNLEDLELENYLQVLKTINSKMEDTSVDTFKRIKFAMKHSCDFNVSINITHPIIHVLESVCSTSALKVKTMSTLKEYVNLVLKIQSNEFKYILKNINKKVKYSECLSKRIIHRQYIKLPEGRREMPEDTEIKLTFEILLSQFKYIEISIITVIMIINIIYESTILTYDDGEIFKATIVTEDPNYEDITADLQKMYTSIYSQTDFFKDILMQNTSGMIQNLNELDDFLGSAVEVNSTLNNQEYIIKKNTFYKEFYTADSMIIVSILLSKVAGEITDDECKFLLEQLKLSPNQNVSGICAGYQLFDICRMSNLNAKINPILLMTMDTKLIPKYIYIKPKKGESSITIDSWVGGLTSTNIKTTYKTNTLSYKMLSTKAYNLTHDSYMHNDLSYLIYSIMSKGISLNKIGKMINQNNDLSQLLQALTSCSSSDYGDNGSLIKFMRSVIKDDYYSAIVSATNNSHKILLSGSTTQNLIKYVKIGSSKYILSSHFNVLYKLKTCVLNVIVDKSLEIHVYPQLGKGVSTVNCIEVMNKLGDIGLKKGDMFMYTTEALVPPKQYLESFNTIEPGVYADNINNRYVVYDKITTSDHCDDEFVMTTNDKTKFFIRERQEGQIRISSVIIHNTLSPDIHKLLSTKFNVNMKVNYNNYTLELYSVVDYAANIRYNSYIPLQELSKIIEPNYIDKTNYPLFGISMTNDSVIATIYGELPKLIKADTNKFEVKDILIDIHNIDTLRNSLRATMSSIITLANEYQVMVDIGTTNNLTLEQNIIEYCVNYYNLPSLICNFYKQEAESKKYRKEFNFESLFKRHKTPIHAYAIQPSTPHNLNIYLSHLFTVFNTLMKQMQTTMVSNINFSQIRKGLFLGLEKVFFFVIEQLGLSRSHYKGMYITNFTCGSTYIHFQPWNKRSCDTSALETVETTAKEIKRRVLEVKSLLSQKQMDWMNILTTISELSKCLRTYKVDMDIIILLKALRTRFYDVYLTCKTVKELINVDALPSFPANLLKCLLGGDYLVGLLIITDRAQLSCFSGCMSLMLVTSLSNDLESGCLLIQKMLHINTMTGDDAKAALSDITFSYMDSYINTIEDLTVEQKEFLEFGTNKKNIIPKYDDKHTLKLSFDYIYFSTKCGISLPPSINDTTIKKIEVLNQDRTYLAIKTKNEKGDYSYNPNMNVNTANDKSQVAHTKNDLYLLAKQTANYIPWQNQHILQRVSMILSNKIQATQDNRQIYVQTIQIQLAMLDSCDSVAYYKNCSPYTFNLINLKQLLVLLVNSKYDSSLIISIANLAIIDPEAHDKTLSDLDMHLILDTELEIQTTYMGWLVKHTPMIMTTDCKIFLDLIRKYFSSSKSCIPYFQNLAERVEFAQSLFSNAYSLILRSTSNNLRLLMEDSDLVRLYLIALRCHNSFEKLWTMIGLDYRRMNSMFQGDAKTFVSMNNHKSGSNTIVCSTTYDTLVKYVNLIPIDYKAFVSVIKPLTNINKNVATLLMSELKIPVQYWRNLEHEAILRLIDKYTSDRYWSQKYYEKILTILSNASTKDKFTDIKEVVSLIKLGSNVCSGWLTTIISNFTQGELIELKRLCTEISGQDSSLLDLFEQYGDENIQILFNGLYTFHLSFSSIYQKIVSNLEAIEKFKQEEVEVVTNRDYALDLLELERKSDALEGLIIDYYRIKLEKFKKTKNKKITTRDIQEFKDTEMLDILTMGSTLKIRDVIDIITTNSYDEMEYDAMLDIIATKGHTVPINATELKTFLMDLVDEHCTSHLDYIDENYEESSDS